MPVKIPDGLPAVAALAAENIFVMTSERAVAQDIRPLHIAILNLMPTKEATETQLLRLLGNTSLQVEITLLRTASYESRNAGKEHLDAFYRTFDEVKAERFDGLIITGAPVEKMEFEDVAYWEELTRVMEWADNNVFSTFYICWAAQAALHHFHGIDKRPLPEKIFGVFEHRVLNQKNKLVRGFDDAFFAPHSRHTTVDIEDILKVPELELLASSDVAGAYLIASRDGRQVFATGHSEYDTETLAHEYFRDVGKGLPIDVPVNYYPNDDPTLLPKVTWRAHANILFGNWLNYFVYQETPYDLLSIGKRS